MDHILLLSAKLFALLQFLVRTFLPQALRLQLLALLVSIVLSALLRKFLAQKAKHLLQMLELSPTALMLLLVSID